MENKTDKKLLTGNEAIARGAYEAGVKVATAYPGTPSTEILENIAKYKEIYCQWSVNEKVALEVASGASIAGVRVLVAMKHVGLNVASDPFMTLAYTGVNGGLVIVSADDPFMHSSQNEQDNRFYAKFAKVPMLEPTDSQEALDLVKEAFRISEDFDTPVILRTTTRISHSRSLVITGSRVKLPERKYEKDAQKYVMIPAYGRIRHEALLERWARLKDFCENEKLHEIFKPRGKNSVNDIGIITSGVSYQYSREIFYNIPILKLKITNPLPEKAIRDFSRGKRLLIVIEELEPFLEEQIRLLDLGVKITGKDYFPQTGELSLAVLEKVYSQLFGTNLLSISDSDKIIEELTRNLPQRPPVLCAGCSHRSVFYILKKLKVKAMGDIGCYTLSVLPPLSALDSCLCMGAGIGQALGMEKADPDLRNKVVSVIGDSTFFHSGITPLVDSSYNNGTGLIIILDNGTTAMTGHQVHPGTGKTLMGADTKDIKPEAFAAAAGIKNIRVVDPYDIKTLEKILKEELERKELSVVVCRRKCVLLDRVKVSVSAKFYIDESTCEKCGICLKFGCPAIELKGNNYSINELLCTSCGVCADICRSDSIKKK
ncbi:MAG: indolepyruvate ferredoxin oxidoreductase subunit alpha [Actinobacteria bacterium]|nr:indolepyruvate ferredoxin oxidoreductase subunit alpha [Actinomycetota bacterium]